MLTVSRCGNASVINNTIVNTLTETKKLKYGQDKCKKLHIGKASESSE